MMGEFENVPEGVPKSWRKHTFKNGECWLDESGVIGYFEGMIGNEEDYVFLGGFSIKFLRKLCKLCADDEKVRVYCHKKTFQLLPARCENFWLAPIIKR